MAKYYGIERSSEHLTHYGVKGMKWGVRKAIESGNTRALAKHWAKAVAKRNALAERAKTGKGIQARRIGQGALASGLISGIGTYALNRASGVSPVTSGIYAGGAALGGAIGGGLLNAGKPSPMEMSRAKMDHDDWVHAMKSAFKGTKYAGKIKKGSQVKQPIIKKQTTKKEAVAYARDMFKNQMRGQLVGGPIGQAVAAYRMRTDNPQAYNNYVKQFKKMTPKQRLKAMYGKG